MFLERDQLVADTSRPLPPANTGPALRVGLWALRIFVLGISAMVLYTFVDRL